MFESIDCLFGYLWISKINFIPRLILEILDFQEFCNLIGQEHTRVSVITLNWNLWKNSLFLWMSIKRNLKLTYHCKVTWACPDVLKEAQLIISKFFHPLNYWLYASTLSRSIGLSGILQSDRSIGSLTIK